MPDATADPLPCDAEPIRGPAAIQPPGVLLAARLPDLTITQASDNAALALGADRPLVGSPVADWFDPADVAALAAWLDRPASADPTAQYLRTVQPFQSPGRFHVFAHRQAAVLVVELQPTDDPAPLAFGDLYGMVRTGIAALEAAATPEDLWRAGAAEVRRLTGFDRVMVYRFDAEWNGQVVAESVAGDMDGWLGLRYPASDIPAQARELYRTSRVRLVADTAYVPVPIRPAAGPPLDLTHAINRSVSPVHLEYLRNMGVAAAMSVSIVRDGLLWGLVLCHHRTPRAASFAARTAADLLGQVLGLQLSAKERMRTAEAAIGLRSLVAELVRSMADAGDVGRGLAARPSHALAVADAAGVAATDADAEPVMIGTGPDPDDVRRLAEWLAESVPADVYQTDCLSEAFPPAAAYAGRASGLMAVAVSRADRAYVLWFRPEVFQDRYWAGDPHKPHEIHANGRTFRPRTDFQAWKQTLRDHAEPWEAYRADAADQLRQAAVGIVLRVATERARLTTELQRSNRELEAFSYSVSHDLRAPFRHIAGFAELLTKRSADALDETGRRYVKTIADSAKFAGTLVDSLLALSQVGRSAMRVVAVDLDRLMAEVRREVTATDAAGRDIDWQVGPLPAVAGDVIMLRSAFRNLLSNAVKYTRPRPRATVTVDAVPAAPAGAFADRPDPAHVILRVADDGVGMDLVYRDKLFGVFQRLHKAEEFEGTGIGLANVRRIVERHGGRVGVTSTVGVGTAFYVSLPAAGE